MNQKKAIDILTHSGVILYPTDTILGLGCMATDQLAIKKLYELKKRPSKKSFIILVASERQLEQLVTVPDLAWDIMDLAEKPTTIVYENPKGLPKELCAEDNTIAIRLTKDKLCQGLIQKINAPLVSTSANISGHPAPNTFLEISQAIRNKVDYILRECKTFQPKYKESSIIKLKNNGEVKVIRA